MRIFYCVILSLLLTGCGLLSKPKDVDPCKKADTLCWGPAGVNPSDVPACADVISCNDWELKQK